jgi:hypothetical protein
MPLGFAVIQQGAKKTGFATLPNLGAKARVSSALRPCADGLAQRAKFFARKASKHLGVGARNGGEISTAG